MWCEIADGVTLAIAARSVTVISLWVRAKMMRARVRSPRAAKVWAINSAYDASYAALARGMDLPLVTADNALGHKLVAAGLTILPLWGF
jgi:predicted nucleic acid-binding protein